MGKLEKKLKQQFHDKSENFAQWRARNSDRLENYSENSERKGVHSGKEHATHGKFPSYGVRYSVTALGTATACLFASVLIYQKVNNNFNSIGLGVKDSVSMQDSSEDKFLDTEINGPLEDQILAAFADKYTIFQSGEYSGNAITSGKDGRLLYVVINGQLVYGEAPSIAFVKVFCAEPNEYLAYQDMFENLSQDASQNGYSIRYEVNPMEENSYLMKVVNKTETTCWQITCFSEAENPIEEFISFAF